MKKLLKTSAISFAGIMLSLGAVTVSAQSGSIDTTGPDSENVISHDMSYELEVENDTNLDANLDIEQDATSGNATTTHNTEAGDAETGDADNSNDIEATVDISNSSATSLAEDATSCGCGSNGNATIERTGPDSENRIVSNHSVDIEVENDNDVDVDVDVEQDAETGHATVSDNTIAGSATTGNASNSSSTVLSFSIRN